MYYNLISLIQNYYIIFYLYLISHLLESSIEKFREDTIEESS